MAILNNQRVSPINIPLNLYKIPLNHYKYLFLWANCDSHNHSNIFSEKNPGPKASRRTSGMNVLRWGPRSSELLVQ